MKKITTEIVGAFTDEFFQGNPAGVCLIDETLDSTLMLAIAREVGYWRLFVSATEDRYGFIWKVAKRGGWQVESSPTEASAKTSVWRL
ncbi:MAG: PhzF family phenazine biosynthesis protein [Saprospiraceae bacterium]|nr:PhzF family phenazine biosynthesis protein [Saprospiraceae bacterium]